METNDSMDSISPFAEESERGFFYTGAGRGEVVEQILEAVNNSHAFITLSAEDGSGKSRICRSIQQTLPDSMHCVFLPSQIESFEDVVKIIIQEIGLTLSAEQEALPMIEQLNFVQRALVERGQKLLMIFDDAENLYLATLERARKMLDQVNDGDVAIQMLLAGRMLLKDNLRQLLLCNFNTQVERHLSISPMNEEETYEYLNSAIAASANKESWAGVFNRETTDKIYSVADGNFRMTNVLAEQALGTANSDTSFMVLLDNIEEEEHVIQKPQKNNSLRKKKPALKKIVPYAVVAMLAILLLAYLWPLAVDEKNDDSELKIADTQPADKVGVDKKNKKKAKKKDTKQDGKSADKNKTKKDKKADSKEVSKPEPPVEPEPDNKSEVDKANGKIEKTTPPVPDDRYEERKLAGMWWANGMANDKYTVQLMVLVSKNAETNLRNMLRQKEYKEIMDHLYILKKIKKEPMILVFYGEYPSMSAARTARNNLPVFLRKHHPYAISIGGAVNKIK